jgi:hypothetical protein
VSARWLQSFNTIKCFKVKEKEERREKEGKICFGMEKMEKEGKKLKMNKDRGKGRKEGRMTVRNFFFSR